MIKHIFLIFTLSFLINQVPVEARTFKMATLAPNGSTWMNEITRAADEIAEKTSGRVKFKFYTGGIMGSSSSVLKKIRINQLHGGAFTSGELAEVYPDIQIYGLPFQFRSYAEIDYVREKMDNELKRGMEKKGMILLGMSDGGFAYVMSNTPVSSINELRDKKVWLPEGDIITQTVYEIMGIAPVPLPLADVYTGLQTGLIDTIGSSPIGAIAFQWHTKVKFVTDIPLFYLTGNLVLDKNAFDKISKEDQSLVTEIMGAAMKNLGKINRKDDEQARIALQKQGVKFIKISAEERRQAESISQDAIKKLGEKGVYTQEMYHLLLKNLNNFRSQNSK